MFLKMYTVLARELRYANRHVHVTPFTQSKYETHYDVLQLPRNCTPQDIRKAFIKLSKQYHPDKNMNADTHKKFVKLNEAYSVLSRPEVKTEYDLSLVPSQKRWQGNYASQTTHTFRDDPLNEPPRRRKHAGDYSYYGIKGVKKVSNAWIVWLCFLFAAVGVSLQVLLINKSVVFSRRKLEEQSQRNGEFCNAAREQARQEGNAAVIRRLQKHAEHMRHQSQPPPSNE